MRINNNVSALNAWRNLSTSNTQMGKSLEKLSSGFRINRAADDASGLVISQSLRAQISGLKQATRNAQDGISVVQTAEGALNEVHSMLNRMRDLAVQSANTGTVGDGAVAAAQAEFNQLTEEIDRIAGSTSFGKLKLLNGDFDTGEVAAVSTVVSTGSAVDAVGAAAWEVPTAPATPPKFTVTVGNNAPVEVDLAATAATDAEKATALQTALNDPSTGLDTTVTYNATSSEFEITSNDGTTFTVVSSLTGQFTVDGGTVAVTGTAGDPTKAATFQVGAYSTDTIDVSIKAVTAAGLGLKPGGVNLSLANADNAMTELDKAIDKVSTLRGDLGAVQNRFESTINNLQVTTENLVASESRIRDVDMASEMTNFTKQQVLLQAGTAMLGQANSLAQSVLSLLQ